MIKTITIPYQDKEGLRISVVNKKCLHKLASDSLSQELDKFLSNEPPRKNESYILINALGAGEIWGPNNRGDYFPESQLNVENPTYGYKTFEVYGNFYQHHENKVFANRIGYVKKAIWVDDLKKVYLIVSAGRMYGPISEKIVIDIESGKPVATSMGCRVPYEVCSLCLKKITSFPERCEHLKYHMNEILDDGQQIFAINYYPLFFDISAVYSPADQTSYVLAKVASDKVADMEKRFPALTLPLSVDEETYRKAALIRMLRQREPFLHELEYMHDYFDPRELLSALTLGGIALSPYEFNKYFGKFPGFTEEISPNLLSIIPQLAEKRSIFKPYVQKRITIIIQGAPQPPAETTREYLKYKLFLKQILPFILEKFRELLSIIDAEMVGIDPELLDYYLEM